MKQTRFQKALSGVLCMVLTAATALGTTGCSATKPAPSSGQSEEMVVYEAAEIPHQAGEGETTFSFTVTDLDGTEIAFEISTDAETVGDALQELDLIRGEEGPYGLMITTVNGQRHIYEEGSYWAFYIDGEYAMTGADETPIETGKAYAFRATKA